MKIKGNPAENFWEKNPEMNQLSALKDLKEKYDEEHSSKIMWVINAVENPDSQLYNLPKKEKLKELQKHFDIKDIDFKDLVIKNAVAIFKKVFLEKEEYVFSVVSDKVDDIMDYMSQFSVETLDEFKAMSDLMAKYNDIMEAYEKAEKRLKMKRDKKRGSGELGASETGELWDYL